MNIYNAATSGENPINVMSYGVYYQDIYVSNSVSNSNGSYYSNTNIVNINGVNINVIPLLIPDGSYADDSSYQCFTLGRSSNNAEGHVLTANKDCRVDFLLIGTGGSGGIPIDGGVRCNTSGGGAGASSIGGINMKQNDILKVFVDSNKGYDTIQYLGRTAPTIGEESYLGDGGVATINGNVDGNLFTITSGGGKGGRATRDVNIDLNGGDNGTCSTTGDYSLVTEDVIFYNNNPPGGMARYNHNDPNSYGLSSGIPNSNNDTSRAMYSQCYVMGETYLLPSGGGGGGGDSIQLSPQNYNQFMITKINASLYKAGVGMTGGGYGNRMNATNSYKNAWLPGGGGGGAPQESRGDFNLTGIGGQGVMVCVVRYKN